LQNANEVRVSSRILILFPARIRPFASRRSAPIPAAFKAACARSGAKFESVAEMMAIWIYVFGRLGGE
jgi:hypothetical protein